MRLRPTDFAYYVSKWFAVSRRQLLHFIIPRSRTRTRAKRGGEFIFSGARYGESAKPENVSLVWPIQYWNACAIKLPPKSLAMMCLGIHYSCLSGSTPSTRKKCDALKLMLHGEALPGGPFSHLFSLRFFLYLFLANLSVDALKHLSIAANKSDLSYLRGT